MLAKQAWAAHIAFADSRFGNTGSKSFSRALSSDSSEGVPRYRRYCTRPAAQGCLRRSNKLWEPLEFNPRSASCNVSVCRLAL
jgi:hypothetical protein